VSLRRTAAATALVRWARERVPLYRELYAGIPPVEDWAGFRALPVLTTARLRATPLCEQVDALDDVLRSQTAYTLQSVVTPRTLVLDEDDTDAAFDQTRAAFALAGIRKGMHVALVAPPWQRYFAAEITDQLGYFGVEAHLVIAHEAAVVARALAALAPQRAIAVDGTPPDGLAGWVTMRQPAGGGPDLYVVPEAGIVAVRREGERSYRVLTRYCLMESGPEGRLLLTALLRYHQPLIRYELPDHGRLERGRLVLEEAAP
jgi:hypothetical protein